MILGKYQLYPLMTNENRLFTIDGDGEKRWECLLQFGKKCYCFSLVFDTEWSNNTN